MGLALAPRRRSRITAAHTRRIAGRRIHHRGGPRRLPKREAPRFDVEASGQAGPARVGTARAVTPASTLPSPAATAWRSRARLKRRPPRRLSRHRRGARAVPGRHTGGHDPGGLVRSATAPVSVFVQPQPRPKWDSAISRRPARAHQRDGRVRGARNPSG